MANVSMSDIKKGVRLIVGEVPYKIVEFQHVKPGKGAAFVRMKMKSFLNGKVVEKLKPQIPDEIEGILKCTNPNCITNKEKIRGRFKIESKNPLKIRCYYCEKFLNEVVFE